MKLVNIGGKSKKANLQRRELINHLPNGLGKRSFIRYRKGDSLAERNKQPWLLANWNYPVEVMEAVEPNLDGLVGQNL